MQELCSALTYSAQKKNPDESIQSGVRWLLRMICAMWSQLDDRVRTDVERKAHNDRREKAERAKRVQRNRQLRLFQLMRYLLKIFYSQWRRSRQGRRLRGTGGDGPLES